MTRPNAPMYVILSTEGMTQAQADEINQLTRELAKSLESHSGSIESVSLGGKNDLPQAQSCGYWKPCLPSKL